jgi:three-Cys-motif partner protein
MLDLRDPADDGLVIPEVGDWSHDKHHFLLRYIDAFTTAMRGKRWSGLHYIDLFAGAGIEQLKSSRRLEWGSPLIAAQAPFPFTRLHLCEKDDSKCEALLSRLGRHKHREPPQVLHGDANENIAEITAAIPDRSLSMAFLDPYGLHLDYETLRALSVRRADLIIFFPDHLDVLRNWAAYYFDNPNSNLDRVLGPGADWRSIRDNVQRSKWAKAFLKLYQAQIGRLGYSEFEYERIPTTGRRLYRLVFCSRSSTGADIWRRVALRKPDRQNTFDYGAPQ